jgi:hypothetical protein
MVSVKQRRSARFQEHDRCDNDDTAVVVVHHEIVAMSEEELQAYFMQPHDFVRCNNSNEETMQIWIRHKTGRVAD